MGQTRVYPVRVNGGFATVLLSADEIIEAAEEGRLMIAPETDDNAETQATGDGREYDHSVPPIEETIAELVRQVPPEAWDSLPEDLSDNLDHYIYGTPKR
jgi:hypothetical protein